MANYSQLEQLMQQISGGNPAQFMAQIDMLRGAREGKPDPLLQVLKTPAERAQADRYAWGADIKAQNPIAGPLSLIPPIAYEGVKAVAPGIMGLLGKVLPQGEQMAVSSETSPASLQNVMALLAGYYR